MCICRERTRETRSKNLRHMGCGCHRVVPHVSNLYYNSTDLVPSQQNTGDLGLRLAPLHKSTHCLHADRHRSLADRSLSCSLATRHIGREDPDDPAEEP